MKRGRIRITPAVYAEAKDRFPQELSDVGREILYEYIQNGYPIAPPESRLGTDLQVFMPEDDFAIAQRRARDEGIGLRDVIEYGLALKFRELDDSHVGSP